MTVACVYRHFDKDGRLLYVGKSLKPFKRMERHKQTTDWFADIRMVTLEHFDHEWQASVAESTAIREERPLYNINCQEKALVNGMFGALSDREAEVLRLLEQGKRVTEIADELLLSVKTVSTYKRRIGEKMNVRSSSDIVLINKARDLGLIPQQTGAA